VISRLAFWFVLLFVLSSVLAGQDESSRQLPRVTLSLPAGTRSEAVQISYFMGGPGGASGGYVKAEKNQPKYVIDAVVEGKAATEMKVVAYLPGCEIVTLDIPLHGETAEQRLVCKPLASISLHGQIFPVSITQDQPVEVEVSYLAEWAHGFYGIQDGPITTIHIATVLPDGDGKFVVELPDLNQQADLGKGDFELILRNRATWDIVAWLRPKDSTANPYGWLTVRSSYSREEQFVAETR
jgi:hypothetical protein